MKRPREFFLILLAVVAALTVWYYCPSARLRRQVEYWVHENNQPYSVPPSEITTVEQRKLLMLGSGVVDLLTGELLQPPPKLVFEEHLPIWVLKWKWVGRELARRKAEYPVRRAESVRALGLLGTNAAPAVPVLLKILPDMPDDAAIALGRIGVATDEVIEALTQQSSNTKDAGSALMAAAALWQLQPENPGRIEQVNLLLAQNSDLNYLIGIDSSHLEDAIRHIGPSTRSMVQRLNLMNFGYTSHTNEPLAKLATARVLWRLTGASRAATDCFTYSTNRFERSGYSDPYLKVRSLISLVRIFSDIPEVCIMAAPALRSIDVSDNRSLQKEKEEALSKIERILNEQNNKSGIAP